MHALASFRALAVGLLTASTATASSLQALDNAPVLHYTLHRRGGAFASTEHDRDNINMTFLTRELERTEKRYSLTKREVKGNKLVRKAKSDAASDGDGGNIMSNVQADGTWYATVKIGEPPQDVEIDINMLVSDFYFLTTTSRDGSRYDDLFSHSNGKSRKAPPAEDVLTLVTVKSTSHPYPTCGLPTDVFRIPTINISLPLAFAHCRPSKYSLKTLGPSGSTLGLAPSEHLSQTGSTSLWKQLLDKEIIQRPIFSLMLINGQEGVLSIGGTAANAVRLVVSQTENELDRLGAIERGETLAAENGKLLAKRGRSHEYKIPRQADWEEGWTWNDVQGAEGWWQILMQSVWVDGSKVLQNQAVVVDMNSPFILAPPLAVKAFYASVSGSYPLPPPYSNFYAFPCLNPPDIDFDFGGTKFPFMRGARGSVADWSGLPGGRFSLGRLKPGSGYCVGAVAETRMGMKEEKEEMVSTGKRSNRLAYKGNLGGNGMRDVWVIGEGFFKGVGGAFDFKDHRVGFRAY